jgi:hypothetical protein
MVYGGFLGRVRLEDEEELTVRRVRDGEPPIAVICFLSSILIWPLRFVATCM